MQATALIAEDEALLAASLAAELARAWPGLALLATVGHGAAAVEQALALRPDVLFLDIRMPGLSGLEAAQALAEDWPEGQPLPLMVFVTAYDQYALQAFEHAATDYLTKPIDPRRLAHTCARLQAALAQRRSAAASGRDPDTTLDATLDRLRALLAASAQGAEALSVATPLKVIQAGAGAAIHMMPVGEVLYFEAADKYVRVVTAQREHLIRTSLRELLPQLDANEFWQVHRSIVVRADALASALRDESGRLTLTLRGHADKLTASRLYAKRFKPM